MLAERERQVQEEIDQKIAAHAAWNAGFVDLTKAPLTPPPEVGVGSTFRTATTEYLPTPPASVSSEQSADGAAADAATMSDSRFGVEPVAVRYASPSFDGLYRGQPSFRRRHGRGGRLWIDRRGPRLPASESLEGQIRDTSSDRYRFDEDDEDEVPVYSFDPFDNESVRFRARLFPPQLNQAQQQAARRAQIEAVAQNSRSTNSAATMSSQAAQSGG